jgi:predicted anti-sigma-YlaC factor YlaD
MMPTECEFEADALSAALESRWPEQVDAQLRGHVAGCPICSDVVAIASAMTGLRDEMRARVVIPDSGLVWWRAQLQARREAAAAAGRPITAVQLIAFASAVAFLGACFGATSTWFQSTFRRIVSSVGVPDATAFLHSASAFLTQHGAFVLGVTAMLLLIPTAVYLALARD